MLKDLVPDVRSACFRQPASMCGLQCWWQDICPFYYKIFPQMQAEQKTWVHGVTVCQALLQAEGMSL